MKYLEHKKLKVTSYICRYPYLDIHELVEQLEEALQLVLLEVDAVQGRRRLKQSGEKTDADALHGFTQVTQQGNRVGRINHRKRTHLNASWRVSYRNAS